MINYARRRNPLRSFLAVALVVAGLASCGIGQEYLSGIKWPEPPIIEPGKTDADPPSDAIVLFDGKDLSAWEGSDPWKVEDGVAIVQGGEIKTKQTFGDCQLHIEWSSPVPATGESQGRGNSGVFLMDRYELQILDSYENKTYFDGQASAIYKQTPPMVNAMRKPGEWNTYDIVWTAPKFKDDGSLESPAYITVLHNGVLTLNHFELQGLNDFAAVPSYTQHGPAPIRIQDHGNPVRFRNIWVRELKPLVGKKEREPYFRDGTGKEWPAKKTNTEVEGKVSVDGEPLLQGTITFSAGEIKRAVRIKNGKFQVNDLQADEYVVTLRADDANKSAVPAKFRNAERSPLKLNVMAGKNECNLELSAK